MQQSGIDFLVQLIDDDAHRLNVMEQGWGEVQAQSFYHHRHM
jgi:hypothetical protein